MYLCSTATTVQTLACSDADNEAITYTIVGGDDTVNKFFIPNVNEGVIETSKTALDYETKTSYKLIITLVDGGSTHTSTATVFVQASYLFYCAPTNKSRDRVGSD